MGEEEGERTMEDREMVGDAHPTGLLLLGGRLVSVNRSPAIKFQRTKRPKADN